MAKKLLCAMVLVVLVTGADAQPKPDRIQPPQPPRPPQIMPATWNGPQVVEAQGTKREGQLTVTENVTVYKKELRTVIKVVNGEKITSTYTVAVPVMVTRTKTIQVDGKRTKAYDTKGKVVDPATVSKMLQKKTPVVITYGNPVSSLFRRVLKPNTLNVVLPPQVQPPGPAPMPVPGPAVDDLPAPKVIDPDQR